MNLQEYIEEALQDLLEARTYISTNSITVARRTDREATDKGDVFVDILADGEERLSNNHDKYFMEVGISAVAKIQEDLTGNDLDALWAELSEYVTQVLTTTILQTQIDTIDALSGINIDGLNYLPSDVPITLDQYEHREQRLQLAITYS